jgi:hypothetical protein
MVRGRGSWTRSVARSVMKQTHCPLAVAPQATARPGQHRALAELKAAIEDQIGVLTPVDPR